MTSERNDAGGLRAPSPTGIAGPSGPADRLGRWFLGRSATVLVAAWCLAILAVWAPNYLTWPWFTDHDHFAMIAQSWSRGRVLYRELFTTQPPGEIYLFRAVGECFGWGNSTAYYAIDLAMVLLFGVLAAFWSRRRFGRVLPGLVGFNAFLAYYSYQDFFVAGQRDWHGSFLAVGGFFALDLLPGRPGRIASGLALGAALSIRPQFVLVIPGMFLALGLRAGGGEGGWKRVVVAWAEWCLAAGVMLLIAFLPLIVGGLLPDFVGAFRSISYGAGLSPSVGLRARRFAVNMRYYPEVIAVLIALGAMALRAAKPVRAEAATLLVLVLSMMLFGVLSPENHAYYRIPIYAFGAAAAAFLAAFIVALPGPAAARALSLALLIVATGAALPIRDGLKLAARALSGSAAPAVAAGDESYGPVQAVRYLAERRLPDLRPPGRHELGPRYPWKEYRAAIEHVRRSTTPETPAVNLLVESSTAVVGQIPRPMPMRCDAIGMCYFPALVPGGVETLASTKGCVVIWDPGVGEGNRPEAAPLCRIVRERYHPEARFGNIEVWRHNDDPPG